MESRSFFLFPGSIGCLWSNLVHDMFFFHMLHEMGIVAYINHNHIEVKISDISACVLVLNANVGDKSTCYQANFRSATLPRCASERHCIFQSQHFIECLGWSRVCLLMLMELEIPYFETIARLWFQI